MVPSCCRCRGNSDEPMTSIAECFRVLDSRRPGTARFQRTVSKGSPTHLDKAADMELEEETEAEGIDYRCLLRGNQTALVRGTKDFAPDGSERQNSALVESRNALYQVLREERRASKRTLSEAIWHHHSKTAEVTLHRGTHFQVIGTTVDKTLRLLPEEALFMLERNALTLRYLGGIVSVQHGYNLLLDDAGMSMNVYQIYAYLKRLGYIVLRSRPKPTVPQYHSPVMAVVQYARDFIIRWMRWLFGHWLSPTWPLVKLRTCRLAGDIYKQLQVVPRVSISSVSRPVSTSTLPFIVFDVYKPRTGFRKSNPGPPNFRVVAQRASDGLPDYNLLRNLFDHTEEGVQLKVGIVDGGNVSFLSLYEPKPSPF
ncbi:uncharacterized protein SPPG_07249 [Spizellomyces punctatus DAOM BR117]|uniref:tRNA-splicing endonuclease subunit Sen54 N-terminal domain-containing protein n=1 Tax=Spizellomyces punctatus (strain DAOM BR117) TaxID=645134 RepID=A0A0L0H722_SPIPD|nr:uncharacterized protein SPPG_07249 [Spizellomyces punctatus DAOM BR117]KNC97320.1 hypothetical protein SPPG_07249 [Spizellomyces punctatus DAOM BR117]|eukprot:XP_016605360.1 hypothetical protein SPPG_07249 [Spizellomyces punctatus DAOM BR117]